MGAEKTLRRVLTGTAGAAIRFDDLCRLLENLGYSSKRSLVRNNDQI